MKEIAGNVERNKKANGMSANQQLRDCNRTGTSLTFLKTLTAC